MKIIKETEYGQEIVEKEWEYKGYKCVVKLYKVGTMTWRCGYAGIPKGHKLFNVDYYDLDITVHGGLTFGENDLFGTDDTDIWWIGFDCNHWEDTLLPEPRSLEYCIAQCEFMVEQLVQYEGVKND